MSFSTPSVAGSMSAAVPVRSMCSAVRPPMRAISIASKPPRALGLRSSCLNWIDSTSRGVLARLDPTPPFSYSAPPPKGRRAPNRPSSARRLLSLLARIEARNEGIAPGLDMTGKGCAEMGRQHQGAAVRAMLQHPAPGGPRLYAIGAGFAVPGRVIDLERVMHDVTDEDRAILAGREFDRHMARRVPRRRLDQEVVVQRVRSLHDLGPARFHHRQHAVLEGGTPAGRVPIDGVVGFELRLAEHVSGVGEGGNPAAVREPRVPADAVDMHMGAEDEVHLLG